MAPLYCYTYVFSESFQKSFQFWNVTVLNSHLSSCLLKYFTIIVCNWLQRYHKISHFDGILMEHFGKNLDTYKSDCFLRDTLAKVNTYEIVDIIFFTHKT